MSLKTLLSTIKTRLTDNLDGINIYTDVRQVEKMPCVTIALRRGNPDGQVISDYKLTVSFDLELATASQDALFDLIDSAETAMSLDKRFVATGLRATNNRYSGFSIGEVDTGSKIYSAVMSFSVDLIRTKT